MTKVLATTLPAAALLQTYARRDDYVDCFVTQTAGNVPLARFVEAFYTTWLFRMERAILTLAAMPATDLQAQAVATGSGSTFAAWRVEARAEDQLLLCDVTARTRSWFMVTPPARGGADRTLLYFGSAITAAPDPRTGKATIGVLYRSLVGVHKVYSRALLKTAAQRLRHPPSV